MLADKTAKEAALDSSEFGASRKDDLNQINLLEEPTHRDPDNTH